MSRTPERAAATAAGRGSPTFTELDRLLDETRPDAVYACLPPYLAPQLCDCLIGRGLPFLVEKPLAARDGDAPPRIADAIERAGLVVAVGYHWRGLDVLPEVRRRLAERPPELVLARWIDDTPGPDWWGRVDQGGGQVVEQATHLYDLARHLVGEAPSSVRRAPPSRPRHRPRGRRRRVDVGRPRGSPRVRSARSSTRGRTAPPVIELELDGPTTRATIRLMTEREELAWELVVVTPDGVTRTPNGRDPYEVQAEAFLDAVEAGDPGLVLATYRDALATDRLTRSVVAAAGVSG